MRKDAVWPIAALALMSCQKAPKNETEIAREQHIATPQASQPSPSAANVGGDGPFGVFRGEPLSQLDKPDNKAPGIYILASVPQPYPGVETFSVQNTPEHGTCMVKAVGSSAPSDSMGLTLKGSVDKVKDDVSERYGQPSKHYDMLSTGSIWNDPQDWMMGVTKQERYYSYYWNAPKDADPKIWRGVQSVGVEAHASGQNGWWTLEYDFVGNEDCDKDLKKLQAKSL